MQMSFRQISGFVAAWRRLGLTDEDLQALEKQILESPDSGSVMSGTGGIRKLRFAPPSMHTGKRGATRVCYAVIFEDVCYLFTVFPKNEMPNLSAADKKALHSLIADIRKHHTK
jgi:hypothetical protein